MAMVRSALGKVSRRLSGSSAVMRRRGPETMMIPQAPPPLPSLRPASLPWWISRPGPAAQLMTRAFSSPAPAHPSAAAARVRRIPNLQGLQHPPFICKGTEGLQWAGQKRFFSVEAKAKDAKLLESARHVECLRSDEHAKDCTTADNGDRNSSYRTAEYGCHDPYACPWYRALVAQYAVMLLSI
uniref:Uncharacterized protein n=1 Tax=Oryza punctata TaxID=4537 RepID=A0A0E0LGF8_ORYPU